MGAAKYVLALHERGRQRHHPQADGVEIRRRANEYSARSAPFGAGVSTGPLVNAEEAIEDYGYRVWLEWARNAVVTTKAEQQKDSADIFGEAKPLLSDWIKEMQRDEIIAALMALPSESQPTSGTRVNGIQYDLASAAQRNTWQTDNSDRILYGVLTSNLSAGSHTGSLLNVDTTADKASPAFVSLMKRQLLASSEQVACVSPSAQKSPTAAHP